MPVCRIPASTDYIHNCKLLDCEMVRDDLFYTNRTEKFKMLEGNKHKTDSFSSHRCSDKYYLEQKSQYLHVKWLTRISEKN